MKSLKKFTPSHLKKGMFEDLGIQVQQDTQEKLPEKSGSKKDLRQIKKKNQGETKLEAKIVHIPSISLYQYEMRIDAWKPEIREGG
jgi:hypothetical protein